MAGDAVNEGLAIFLSSLVTGAASVVGVLIATGRQTRRIAKDHREALADQTDELKQHFEGGPAE